jgi:hypothetical protein
MTIYASQYYQRFEQLDYSLDTAHMNAIDLRLNGQDQEKKLLTVEVLLSFESPDVLRVLDQ